MDNSPEYRSPAERAERMRDAAAVITRALELAKREHTSFAAASAFDNLVRANEGEFPSADDLAVYLDHFGDL